MSRKNHHYSSELKYQAVGEYLKGQKTLDAVCKKYGILSDRQLRNWIKLYNSHTELKSYTGGSRMTKGRSTTYEERIALVRECIQPFAKFTHFGIRTHSVECCGSFRTFRRGFRTFRTS